MRVLTAGENDRSCGERPNPYGRLCDAHYADRRLAPRDHSAPRGLHTGDSAARRRQPYPSDLNDAQWEAIRPRLSSGGSGRVQNLRAMLDAVNYRWCTGCAWRMLPHDFGPWQTVYGHFRAWRAAGLLPEIRDIVLAGRVRDAGNATR